MSESSASIKISVSFGILMLCLVYEVNKLATFLRLKKVNLYLKRNYQTKRLGGHGIITSVQTTCGFSGLLTMYYIRVGLKVVVNLCVGKSAR